MNAVPLSPDRPPTNNEKRALKSNRCVSENFRSVCNSLESDFKSRKSDLNASKARFLKSRRGKLPTVSSRSNSYGNTCNAGSRVAVDSQSLKHEKAKQFSLPRLEGSNYTSGKNKCLEMQKYSNYDKKNRTTEDCYFGNGDAVFSLGSAQRVRKISKSLGDLRDGVSDGTDHDQVFSDSEEPETNHPIPEHLAKILPNKKKTIPAEETLKEEGKQKHCFEKKVDEKKLARNSNFSRSLNDIESEMIAAALQLEANAFLKRFMLKNRVGSELTHSDCDLPQLQKSR